MRVDANKLKLKNINSRPDDGSQDVGFRYYTTLPGTIDQYPVSTKNMEKNEVVMAKWINLEELDNYTWAWNHRDLIDEIGTHVFGKDVFNTKAATEICYPFKCDDGVRVDIFGTANKYGHTDYADCATYDHEFKDTARNNFIRAYKEVLKLHRIRPMKMDKMLKELIDEANRN